MGERISVFYWPEKITHCMEFLEPPKEDACD